MFTLLGMAKFEHYECFFRSWVEVMSLILHSGAGGVLVMDTNERSRALFVSFLFLLNERRKRMRMEVT